MFREDEVQSCSHIFGHDDPKQKCKVIKSCVETLNGFLGKINGIWNLC